jgi:hypothetical protein
MNFSGSVADIVALIMAVAGVAVLLFGTYAIFLTSCETPVEYLLLISGALLELPCGYLFGKSQPNHEKNDIKDLLLQSIQKPR